jgi:hypothetical protein
VTGFLADLPMPPTTNTLFANVIIKGKQRRIVSREYKAWRKAAEGPLLTAWEAAGKPAISKPYAMLIQVNISHQGDITNRVKALEDLIVSTIPGIPGDQWVNDSRVIRNRDIEAARVEVWSL